MQREEEREGERKGEEVEVLVVQQQNSLAETKMLHLAQQKHCWLQEEMEQQMQLVKE